MPDGGLRNRGTGTASAQRKRATVRSQPGVRKPFRNRVQRRSRTTVGVDLSADGLRLVKVRIRPKRLPELQAVREVSRPEGLDPQSSDFSEWLGNALRDLCGRPGRCGLWLSLPTSIRASVSHLYIPKVPWRQVPNAVYWAVKKEAPFVEDDTIVDFEVEGQTILDGLPKIVVNGYTVSRHDVAEIRNIFKRAGYPLTGVAPSPCGMRNLLNADFIPDANGTCVFFHIGSDDSRITILAQSSIALSRGIKSGLNAVLDPLIGKGKVVENVEGARDVLATVSLDPQEENETDAENVRIAQAVRPALRRLISNIERTLEYYSGDLKAEGIDTIYVSGPIVRFQPLLDYMSGLLGCQMSPLDPVAWAGDRSTEAAAAGNREAGPVFGQAAGVALSGAYATPNLLHTQVEEGELQAVTRANWWVVGFCAVFAAVTLGTYYWFGAVLAQKREIVTQLEKRLSAAGPEVQFSDIQALVVKAKQEQVLNRAFCKDYQSVAVVNELVTKTPRAIQLLRLSADLSIIPKPKEPETAVGQAQKTSKGTVTPAVNPKQPKKPEKENSVLLEGVVSGGPQVAASHLATYMHDLDRSPLFGSPVLEENNPEAAAEGSLVRFTLRIPVAEY